MRIQRTYYEVMGLPNTASEAEIKARYYDLARQFHPDRAQDKVVAQRLFSQINIAYRGLIDPQKRSIYDASLNDKAVATTSANGQGGSQQGGLKHPQPKTDPIKPSRTEPIKANPQRPNQPVQNQLTVEQALQKANGAYMSGDRRTAQQLCQNIIRADSGNAQAHVLLGDIYSDLGQRVEALSEYRTAVNAGDHSRLVQEKIKRLETQSGISARPGSPPASGQRPPPSPPPRPGQPPGPTKKPEPPKKGGFFDRIIGRGK